MNTEVSRRAFMATLAGAAAVATALPQRSWAAAPMLYGPSASVVKLNANENPYGPSPKALEAIAKSAAEGGAYYPGKINRALAEMIAERHGLTADHVVLTSGSMECLFAAAAAFTKYGRIVAPGLTFGPHLTVAERMGGEVLRVPLTGEMDQDLERMAAVTDSMTSLVYVCNPNNPTGLTVEGGRMRAFCEAVSARATVMVDEAYNELTDNPDATSMVDLVRRGENVIITRTFSKLYGLAGLRVGYALAPPHLAEMLKRHAMTSPSVVGAAAALASYNDEAFLAYSKSKIVEGRQMVEALFDRLEIPHVPSQTNFVYADIGRDADAFQAKMRAENVLIRGVYEPYKTWSRVSMGKLEDLERFVQTFERVYTLG